MFRKCALRLTLILALFLAGLPGCSPSASSPADRHDKAQTATATGPATEADRPALSVHDPYPDIRMGVPVVNRMDAGEMAADGWCFAESVRGHFTVDLPGKFVDSMIKSRSTTGGIGVMHTVRARDAHGVEFSVLETECIGEKPAAMSDPAKSLAEEFEKKGAKVSRKAVTVASLAGERLSLSSTGVAAEMVVLVDGQNDYMLAVQWHGKPDKDLNEEIERFIASFKINTPEVEKKPE